MCVSTDEIGLSVSLSPLEVCVFTEATVLPLCVCVCVSLSLLLYFACVCVSTEATVDIGELEGKCRVVFGDHIECHMETFFLNEQDTFFFTEVGGVCVC